MNITQEIKKERIIKRMIRHSEVFTSNYLSKKSFEELRTLQKDCLIELRIKMRYHSRHTQGY